MEENMGITVDMLVSVYNDLTKKMANTRFKAFASHLRKHELTLNQYSILSYIERENACSSIQLAQHLNLKAASITYLVDSLEKKGLVKRVNNPEDRRSQRILLTEEGNSIASYSVDNTLAITFFENMDQDDREILYMMARIMNKKFPNKIALNNQSED